MTSEIASYHAQFTDWEQGICTTLETAISTHLPDAEGKIWHGHPVWFLNENPVAGYAKQKNGIQLLFWSGQSFDEPGLQASGKFKAAECIFTESRQPDPHELQRWLEKSRAIQWDYKNLVKRKGQLERLS